MAVSTTSGIRDDLHLHTLGTQIEGNVRSPAESAAVVAPQAEAAEASSALDGEAVLAMDVWQGAATGARPLAAAGARIPATAGLTPRAAIDATAMHVLAALR